MSSLKPKIGETFWVVEDRNRRFPCGTLATVTKVGRKWATLDDGNRFDYTKDGNAERWWRLDGGDYTSPGKVYTSQHAYEDIVRADRVWHQFWGKVGFNRPDGVLPIDIQQAASLLGIEIKER